MSPIKVEMELQDKMLRLPDINTELPGSFKDHSPDDPHVIVVFCNPDDNSGNVYRLPTESSQISADETLRIIDPTKAIIEVQINPDEMYIRNIHTRQGLGKLCLTYY